MLPEHLAVLILGVLLIAVLYSSVGQAGASGYIAVMSLVGLAPSFIKPAALALNTVVALIAAVQFHRAGHFAWRLFWPFAALSVPLAILGGAVSLPSRVFNVLVGCLLLVSALSFVLRPSSATAARPPTRAVAIGVGALLGLIAGVTGTGGGIFFTPLLLGMRWATPRQAAAASAFFVLVNSLAALVGNVSSARALPMSVVPLAGAAMVGGSVGAWLGSRHLAHAVIERVLAVVLLIAGGKLILVP
ncbi:sulfite exporter TauE/SafE family protein [bacterium]|nr:sulfite exporter TauE/SafE family protein [bacterium]